MRWLAKKSALPSTSSSAVGVSFGVAVALLATAVGVRFDLASFSLLVDLANEALLLFNGVSPRPGNSILAERAASESANSCRNIRFECIIRAVWWLPPERCSSSLYGERLDIPRVRSLLWHETQGSGFAGSMHDRLCSVLWEADFTWPEEESPKASVGRDTEILRT